MRATLMAVGVVLILVSLNTSAEEPLVYRNGDFGIVLPVPAGLVLCPQITGLDHGPVILLGSKDAKSCMDPEHRSVSVFAGYNAADVTKHLADLLKWECASEEKAACLKPPNDLKVRGLPSMAARVNRPGGWVEILVVAQAGKPDPDFDASVPSVNYTLRLRTRSEHTEEDLKVFRRVLDTIQLSPPS